jgi:hypothetical protein
MASAEAARQGGLRHWNEACVPLSKDSRPSLQAPWRRLGNRSSPLGLTRRSSEPAANPSASTQGARPQSCVGVPSDLFVAVGRANRHESLADPIDCHQHGVMKEHLRHAAAGLHGRSGEQEWRIARVGSVGPNDPRDHPVNVQPFSTKQTRGPLVRSSRSAEVLPTSALNRVTTQFFH